ncbi:hypothetical protein N0V90_003778 [Kalmusia sp. IMI 367209]|nr:hypothetical protein N0V90_003778 [Kalmusia sp. IMI 367209]
MRFSAITVLSLTALSTALPTKRQAGGVLGTTTYDDISIAGGTAGNAEAEALAVFSALDVNNPENISAEDQDFLNEVNQVANDAEKDAFNPAIEAATGDEATALQNGKIKNKVLKLTATMLKLQAQQAQGEDVADEIATEQTKLDNNIAQDTAAAGEPSTALPFDATIQGAGNAAAAAAGGNAAVNDAAAADDAAGADVQQGGANADAEADDADEADEAEADEADADEAEADEAEADEADADEAEADEADADEAEADEADADDEEDDE